LLSSVLLFAIRFVCSSPLKSLPVSVTLKGRPDTEIRKRNSCDERVRMMPQWCHTCTTKNTPVIGKPDNDIRQCNSGVTVV
jgi:hypothetical protein